MVNNRMYIFHATDYQQYPLGGTLGTIRNYLKYTKFQCILVGITNNPHTKLGVWQRVKINGRYYDFIPVAYSKKEVIPHKILLLLGAILYMRRIMKKCDDNVLNAMFFVNRECYLPVRYIMGRHRKVNAFYKMTDAVNPLTTSGRRIAGIKLLQDIYFKIFFRPLLFGSSLIFSISDECREFCERTLVHTNERKKIIDVKHYVDFECLLSFYQNTQTTKSNDRKILMFWGRIAPVKGLDLVIRSVGKLCKGGENIDLWIIGDGEETANLENLVAQLNLSNRVYFLGRKNIAEIAALCKTADLFLMSSHSEGLPTSMLEALTFGLSVVATPVGGIPTLVREGINGYLVRERELEAYVDGIKMALQLDREKAASYGRELVKTQFSAQSVIKKMDDLIEQAIG